MKSYLIKIKQYAYWVRSCTNVEQIDNLEIAIERNFEGFPVVLKNEITIKKNELC